MPDIPAKLHAIKLHQFQARVGTGKRLVEVLGLGHLGQHSTPCCHQRAVLLEARAGME